MGKLTSGNATSSTSKLGGSSSSSTSKKNKTKDATLDVNMQLQKVHKPMRLRPKVPVNSKSKYETIGQLNYAESHYTEFLKESVENHVGSFNMMLDHILPEMANEIIPIEVPVNNDSETSKPGSASASSKIKITNKTNTAVGLRIGVEKITIDKPMKKDHNMLPSNGKSTKNVLPSDCREGHFTYSGKCTVTFYTQRVGDDSTSRQCFNVECGNVPIMVGSKVCHLHNLSPAEMVKAREDETERGGYFVMNGNERVIRLLIMPKANQLLAIERGSFTNRGDLYTKHAVQIRCMRKDLTTLTNTLHYCRDGTCFFRFSHSKNEFLIPMLVIAYAIAPGYMTDFQMARTLCGGNENDNFSSERVQVMFQTLLAADYKIHSRVDALQFLGDQFRSTMKEPAYLSDIECGLRMVRSFIFVNSTEMEDKFSLLCLMFQKLMRLAEGTIKPENCDALSTQEALLPGQLYGAVLKEAVETTMEKAKQELLKKIRYGDDIFDIETVESVFWRVKEIDHAVNYFLSTGTIKSRSGLDLMQVTGFTIVADKLNAVRYLSHFRAIHRGQFFMEMKTTAVRKLLPDSWGFLCPVHTPDGGPCGLLNHLGQNCQVALTPPALIEKTVNSVRNFLLSLGVLKAANDPAGLNEAHLRASLSLADHYPVVLEGRTLGYVRDEDAALVVAMLRRAKTMSTENVSVTKKLWKKIMSAQVKESDFEHASAQYASGDIADLGPSASSGSGSKKTSKSSALSENTKKRSRRHGNNDSSDSEADVDDHGSEDSHSTCADSQDLNDKNLTIALSSVVSGPQLRDEAEMENEQCIKDYEDMFRQIPFNLEIGFVERSWDRIFPGIFLFVGPCRFTRPIKCLRSHQLEHVGPFEQVFMKIAVTESELIWTRKVLRADIEEYTKSLVVAEKAQDEDIVMKSSEEYDNGLRYRPTGQMEPLVYTHREIDPIKMLSIVASLTPFQNHNQSPRCMYQCQMLKQTMGTPYQNHSRRTDNKVYRIQFPQRPMVRAQMYADAKFDTHPTGMNAIVAVCAYTGYDMEDAMIINKGSYDRGFMAGNVYKQKIIKACPEKDERSRQHSRNWIFSNYNKAKGEYCSMEKHIQPDGTPKVGTLMTQGMTLVAAVNKATGEVNITKHKDSDPCWVEAISLISGGSFQGGGVEDGQVKLSIKLRFNRRPMVGDKFATRHGQKGVMATLWKSEDMPFSARGMVPDILFNPHGFPSRMTIGQLIESMAGKAAALTGTKHVNATAFRKYRGHFNYPDNNEDDPFLEKDPITACDPEKQPMPAEYFGKVLKDYGYDYYGTEELYDGIHGEPMKTHIFMGCVYYQRLRHMVADKAQVRAMGPIDPQTRQPVKGRQRHGGIRLGEMERDALVAHGAAFLVHDRLMRCSDYSVGFCCPKCGSIITPVPQQYETRKKQQGNGGFAFEKTTRSLANAVCPPCTRKAKKEDPNAEDVICEPKDIPFSYRLLTVEFAAMGINLEMRLNNGTTDAYAQEPEEAANEVASRRRPITVPSLRTYDLEKIQEEKDMLSGDCNRIDCRLEGAAGVDVEMIDEEDEGGP
ncbi:unnamed protein product [Amoebophrya sp. A120]|nr:unnamed protein product [Amoebophrya sp. A120]|eukprot:GSA120T00003242001.1